MSLMDTFTQFFTNGTARAEMGNAAYALGETALNGLWEAKDAAWATVQENPTAAIATTVAVGVATTALAVRKYGLPSLPSFLNAKKAANSADKPKGDDKSLTTLTSESPSRDKFKPLERVDGQHVTDGQGQNESSDEENKETDAKPKSRSRSPSPTRNG